MLVLYGTHADTQQRCFYTPSLWLSAKGGLQKDEQKRLVNSLWAWNTNILRKHLWFVHPSVNLTFSVIFIFRFPGQARREQILHVQKICHHLPLLNNTCFRKLLILVFIHMTAFCGGGGGPGAINSLFLTQLQLLLWRIDVRNYNWRLESGSGQFSPGLDENSTGSERQVKYIPWMHLEVRDHTMWICRSETSDIVTEEFLQV